MIEQQNTENTGSAIERCGEDMQQTVAQENEQHDSQNPPDLNSGCKSHHDVLFWLDWLPVRITAFGYMFVGHFSKAMPTWLESIFDSF